MAIDYAEDVGLPIINFSGGWEYNDSGYDYALGDTIDNYSGLLVCAAGNANNDIDDDAVYPASLTSSNILTVSSSTSSKTRGLRANYGWTSVDVFAPGEDIVSCFPTSLSSNLSNGYHIESGTSMAAPHVAGIAALMLSVNPNQSPQAIKSKIISTCTASPYPLKCVSGGIVNACHAVLSAYSSTTMTADSSRSIYLSAGQERWIEFVVPSAGTYTFFTSGNKHTVGELYHPTNGLIERSSNANSSTSSNFYIEEYLTAGTTVYLRVTLKQASASGSFTLYIGS